MVRVAGTLFFIAGTTILMGIITAEIFFNSAYSISGSMISTLASSPPPNSVVREPSAVIFDSSMVFSGALIILGSFLSRKLFGKILTSVLALMGLGAVGVGMFPAFHPVIHPVAALITFCAGGAAALLASRIVSSPFSYICLVLGAVAILFLFSGLFFASQILPILGRGGVERWVAYPIMIWLVGLGGYLMNVRGLNTRPKLR